MESLKWRGPTLKAIRTKREGEEPEQESADGGRMAEAEAEPLSPASIMFHQPGFNVYIIVVFGCQTSISVDVVKAKLTETLLKHPRFCSLQVSDEKNGRKLRWVRTKVDIENHVTVPELDPTMDSPEKLIEDYVSGLSTTVIDPSKPLWDVHLLNLRTAEAAAVGVLRMHHSLGDGTSLMSLLLASTRKLQDPKSLPTVPVKKRRTNFGTAGGLWRRWLMVAWWGLICVLNTIVDVVKFIATAMWLKDTETPIKGPPGVEFRPRRFVHRTVSLDDIKLVKNKMNATINDVALGITQAGLSQYLNRIYGESKKDESAAERKCNLPDNIYLRSTLLINLRPKPGIQALGDLMKKNSEAKWGNWIGYVLLPFIIALRENPLDYVWEAKAMVDRKKHSLEALFTSSIAELGLKLFGVKITSALSHRVISHTTLCFSNLIGPMEEIDFYGHPIMYVAPGCYGQPHALMINFQSYVNKMTIALSVDEDTISDPHQLCNDIVESLRLIKNAVSQIRV